MASKIVSIFSVLTVIFMTAYAKRCPADVAYLVDQSTSITRSTFDEQVIPFLKYTVNQLEIDEHGDHVSVIRFSSPQNTATDIHFDFTFDKPSLVNFITQLGYDGGNTATVQALSIAHDNFFTNQAARTDGYHQKTVAPVVVVVTDGVATDGDAPAKAKDLLSKGVHIFAIGVGPLVTREYLQEITGNNDRVFTDREVAQFNAALAQAVEESTTCP